MKQDLNLSFVDLLGYLLPGTLLAWELLARLEVSFEVDWIRYLMVAGTGYLLGHICLMFHFITIRRWARWLTGDPRRNLPRRLKEAETPLPFGKRLKRLSQALGLNIQRASRHLIGLPPLSPGMEAEIWNPNNWRFLSDGVDLKQFRERDLMHLYWWALQNRDSLYKRNRRLRAFVLLFGNACVSLLVLTFLYFPQPNWIWLACLAGAIACFLSYARYRFFSLRFITVYGYLQLVVGKESEEAES